MNLEAILPNLSSRQLNEAANEAAAAGHLEVLSKFSAITRASDGIGWSLGTPQCKAAAKAGRIDVLTWLHDHIQHDCWTRTVCAAAAKANQLASLCWLRTICNPPCPWDVTTFLCAARRGHLNIFYLLRYLDPPCPWNRQVCEEASRHPACLKWLRQQDPPCPWSAGCFAAAAVEGDLSLMQWMRAQRRPCPWNSETMDIAAERGDLSMVAWLCSQDPPCPHDENAIYAAIAEGHLHIVQYLRERDHPCYWDHTCLMAAVDRGSKGREMLQWILAHDPPCPLRPFMTEACTRAGDMPMLQWLHNSGYALSPSSTYIAAEHGHTHLLRWLLDIGMRPAEPACPSHGWSAPAILLWGDYGLPLNARGWYKLERARSVFCTFQGLIRWCSRSWSSTSSTSDEGSQLVQDPYPFCQHGSPGQLLLTNLARLPVEIVSMIAVAAKLQHDLPV